MSHLYLLRAGLGLAARASPVLMGPKYKVGGGGSFPDKPQVPLSCTQLCLISTGGTGQLLWIHAEEVFLWK